MVNVDDTVIGNLRPVKHIKLFRIFAPRKLTTINNHSADTRASSSNELRHRMHNYIGAVLNGPQQNGRSYGVVDHQGHTVLVRYSGQTFDVGHITSWIANALAVNRASIFVDQLLHILGTITCREPRTDSALWKNVGEKCVGGAIE